MSNSQSPLWLTRQVNEGRLYWSSPAGQAQRQAEQACLGPVCERLFGAHSLELGLGERIADMCPIRHAMSWAPTRELALRKETLVCLPHQLPLPDESLQLVIVHHLLEVVAHPHHVLQESARVTAHNGRLIIFGWGPLGCSGWSRLWPARRGRLPWRGHWRTPGRLRDWLAFVDFEIERVDYCGFRLPGRLPRNSVLETLGRRYNLPWGDAFMIQARRRAQPIQVDKPRIGLVAPLTNTSLARTRQVARLDHSRSGAGDSKRTQVD
ncbi:class I SAM-dependent methyltransferase [Pistricoccus aurantiacus]|uniref:Class I SAM-dependent methyltransferase n=1 Tax=Pistricoccus aurantiacus TaxID=1883414 RepID=A0A5B8SWU8_9GAMM|nr:methyltransferase domain-containing protein [Pistricoccus aurantiacus]QEA40035.1 class I SAM-dependent methyltransferase [Pistricoccus aurantiacus]